MAKEFQIFKNEQFGQIRCLADDKGEPWFVGKDVAEKLGYCNPTKAIRVHVDDDDKVMSKMDTSFGVKDTILINESGLYGLVLSSKLPLAKEFKHWVTSEVLPQIRKTGGYIPVNGHDDENAILSRALLIAKRTIDEQKNLLEEQTPKAEYAELVLLSPTCYTMTQVAKGLSMTVLELTHRLMNMGIIYRSPSGPYMLYAPYLKQGLEAYRTHKGVNLFGDVEWTDTYLVWTEKGREFINRHFI